MARERDKNNIKAIVLGCQDEDFLGPILQFLDNAFGLKPGMFQPIFMGGGCKDLLDHQWREYWFSKIAIGYNPNVIEQKLIIPPHEDCGAYGGKESFTSNDEEKKKLMADAVLASKVIRKEFPFLIPVFCWGGFSGDIQTRNLVFQEFDF